MANRYKIIVRLFTLLFGLCTFTLQAEETSPYNIKAAFLYHFGQFTTWPEANLGKNSFVIGVMGEGLVSSTLKMTLTGKALQNRTISLVMLPETASPDALRRCQILFIPMEYKSSEQRIISEVRGSPTLTVGESTTFLAKGGIIQFSIIDNKIRFKINNTAAERAGIQISSKLLRLSL